MEPKNTEITAVASNRAATTGGVGFPRASNQDATAMSNQELLKRFHNELLIAGYSQRTLTMYEAYVREFATFLGTTEQHLSSATREDIVNFLGHKKTSQTVSNATLSLVHAALRYFFHEFLKKKILEDVKIAKKAKKLPEILSTAEVRDLLVACRGVRSRLILEFLYSTGARVSECVKLKVNDINLKEHVGRVVGGKGNKDRTIILSPAWCTALKKYLNRRKVKSELVFTKKNGGPLTARTIQRLIRKTADRAKIPKEVTAHKLRHAFATHLLEGGENIRKIQELLGHSNLSTTQIYTRVTLNELKKVESPLDRLRSRKKKEEHNSEPGQEE
jgi:integrase/recombinase XerD